MTFETFEINCILILFNMFNSELLLMLIMCYHHSGTCLRCETPSKEPMELAVINDFTAEGLTEKSNSGSFDT